MTKKILILAANPTETTRLRLDKEVRDIQQGLERAQQRDNFSLVHKPAVSPRDIQRALLDETPQIIHFSGHGEGEQGLVFEDEAGNAQLVSGQALASLFHLFVNDIECVLLNGCYSKTQADSIVEHIDYVVGMSQSISDRAAIEFAVAFYDALGAGRQYEFAYKLACAAIQLNASVSTSARGAARKLTPIDDKPESGEHLIPVLLKRAGLSEQSEDLQAQAKKQVLEQNLNTVEQAGQERIEALNRQIAEEEQRLQPTLSKDLQEALEWLKCNQSELPTGAYAYMLKRHADILEEVSQDEKEDFQWELEKYIESVYFSILSNSFSLLDEPVTGPTIDSPEAYQAAFTFIKKKAPGRLGKESLTRISKCFDYLLERLFIV